MMENKTKYYDCTELKNLNDSVGDQHSLSDIIDFDNRDAAFIDLDGEILVSDNGMSHAQLVNKYLEEHNEYKKLYDENARPTNSEMESNCYTDRFAFGHIINNVWIIDTHSISQMDVDEVIEDIKKSCNTYSKLYSLSDSNSMVKRLAKKVI